MRAACAQEGMLTDSHAGRGLQANRPERETEVVWGATLGRRLHRG